jgi:phosphonate metabolism transcriptional regulator PhnF
MAAPQDWKKVEAHLRKQIEAQQLKPGTALPSLNTLARAHGVSRHAARRAIERLRETGHVQSWQGRGSYVCEPQVVYQISSRTRFCLNIQRIGRGGGTRCLATGQVRATGFVAKGLGLRNGEPVLRASLLREIDGRPAMFARHYYDPAKFAGILDILEAGGSVTEALADYNVTDFRRDETIIATRLPSPTESMALEIGRAQPVLVTHGVNIDKYGARIEVSEAVCRGDVVTLAV